VARASIIATDIEDADVPFDFYDLLACSGVAGLMLFLAIVA
jgi:hypothetical protein